MRQVRSDAEPDHGGSGMAAPDRERLTCRWRGLLLWTALLAGTTAVSDTVTGNRLPYTAASPSWLQAVGSLRVPGVKLREGRRTHHRERCSATLVVSAPGRTADTIITAWHCLDFYTDQSRPITFTLPPGRRGELTREASRLGDGGGMDADWAILRLYRPVAAEEVAALPIGTGAADRARPVIMAGYSRDDRLGHGGRRLTYDPACRITAQTPARGDTDCRAHKGASGGAVIQLSPEGEPQFTGVISAGDGASTSIFVPVTHFGATLRQHLR